MTSSPTILHIDCYTLEYSSECMYCTSCSYSIILFLCSAIIAITLILTLTVTLTLLLSYYVCKGYFSVDDSSYLTGRLLQTIVLFHGNFDQLGSVERFIVIRCVFFETYLIVIQYLVYISGKKRKTRKSYL